MESFFGKKIKEYKNTHTYIEDETDDAYANSYTADDSSSSASYNYEEAQTAQDYEENENYSDDIYDTDQHEESYYQQSGSSRYVNFNGDSQTVFVFFKPTKFDDVTEISDHLNAKRPVILNLEAFHTKDADSSKARETARRIVDFIGGVTYANDETMYQTSKASYLIIPRNIELIVNGDPESRESNDVFDV